MPKAVIQPRLPAFLNVIQIQSEQPSQDRNTEGLGDYGKPEGEDLKNHQLTGRIFDSEYDLAVAVMTGMKARSDRHNYTLDRFIFNST
jgi:hypothetical protein